MSQPTRGSVIPSAHAVRSEPKIINYQHEYCLRRLVNLLSHVPTWYCQELADEIEVLLPQILQMKRS